jgi:hypothetical protein
LDQQEFSKATIRDPGPATASSADNRRARRDLYLLAGIFLLTWLVIGAAAEVMARMFFPEQQEDVCHVTESTGGRFDANCHSRIKMFESAWIDNSYNECGYRSALSCKAEVPNALRVAVLGTSISRGYWVSYDQSFAGRVESDLTKACGRQIDLQNVSQADSILVTDHSWIPIWHHIADRVPEALRLQPQALVLVMTSFDLASYTAMPGENMAPEATSRTLSLRQVLSRTVKTVKDYVANESRVMLLARHLAYRDADRYVLHELRQGDSSDYLRVPFTGQWSLRLKVADATIGKVASQARAAGVPLIVVLMPPRVQAALSAPGADRHHTDPFALGRALSSIVQAHGGHFVDMTTVISRLKDPADLFFAVNGHPNADGHAALAASVEAALVGDVPSFAGCGHVGG